MKKSLYFLTAALMTVGSGLFQACQTDYENVDNKVYVENYNPVNTVYLDGSFTETTCTLSCRLALEAPEETYITYGASPELVELYNETYSADALLLPAEYYEFTKPTVIVKAGDIKSSKAEITFKKLDELNKDLIYVLPVSVVESPVGVLGNYRTVYYVFRDASLINVVGSTTGTYLSFENPNQQPELANLTQMTFECLIYPYDFDNMLSTLMGVEDSFLFRIGDAGIPSNQLNIGGRGATDPAWRFDTGKWTFLTVTYDSSTGNTNVYFNGVKKGSTQNAGTSAVNWNKSDADPRGCYIGYSYEIDRDFHGLMSQVRVWNRILTEEEINESNHFYRVPDDAEGLVFYAKFDEGAGNVVHDYANGYTMVVPKTYPQKTEVPGDLGWESVSLPEK